MAYAGLAAVSLARQVRRLDDVAVDDRELSDADPRQGLGQDAAQGAAAHQQGA